MTERDVYYFTRFVLPYRVPILEELNEKLDGKLVVCSGEPPPGSSFESLTASDQPGYRQIRLPNRWFRGESLHYQSYKSAFLTSSIPGAVLVEESPRSLSLPGLLRHARSKGVASILWGHFSSNVRALGSNDLRDRLRIRMARRADALVCYTDQIADQLSNFVNKEKIFVARNTVDTDPLLQIYDRLREEGVQSVRERLSVRHENVVVFLGRLEKEKGTEMLIETMMRLRDRDCLLLVIGDGPERARMEHMADSNGVNIHFTGALTEPEELASYMFASDVMLNPGYLGLSIVHAFAMGVPVVAPVAGTLFRFHSPEWVYVRSGENGILVENATADSFADAIQTVVNERERFSIAALEFAREELSVDRMTHGILEAIRFATRTT